MSKISIEKIITYACEYCNEEFKTKRGTQNHQEKCQYCSDSDSDSGSDSDSDSDSDCTEIYFLCIYCKKEFASEKSAIAHENRCKNNKNIIRKKAIPAVVKRLVWNTYIGENIGKSKCFCCKLTDITQLSFHCGHVVSENNGGKIHVDNLRPICQNCNCSMATKNMMEFMKTHNL